MEGKSSDGSAHELRTGIARRRRPDPGSAFVRSFAVPNSFDTDKIAADFKNGVLSVTLPKKEAAKPRQVKVEVKA